MEYSLLRGSMRALDTRVASRYLADDSPVRAVFGRGLTALDSAAARLLRSDAQPDHDAAVHDLRPSRSDDDSTGAATDPTDAGDDTTAGEDTSAGAAAAEDVVPPEEVERVAEELLEERIETPLAGELAEESADEAQTMAELRAKHIVEEYEMQQRESRD